MKIREEIALDGEIGGGEGNARGGNGVDAGGVIDEIGVEAGFLNFLGGEIFGQLIEDGGDQIGRAHV